MSYCTYLPATHTFGFPLRAPHSLDFQAERLDTPDWIEANHSGQIGFLPLYYAYV